jgi:hypothetical protein
MSSAARDDTQPWTPEPHMVSFAAAFERVLRHKHPGHHWVVEVRPPEDPTAPADKPPEAA